MKKYWKFNYQPGLTYPPNWYGEGIWPIPYEKVTVLLQNDRDGFGIAYCEEEDFGKFEGDIEILAEEDALALVPQSEPDQTPATFNQSQITVGNGEVLDPVGITTSPDETQIWYGDRLAHRWDEKPEELQSPEQAPDEPKSLGAMAIARRKTVTTVRAMGFCGKCMKVRTFKAELPKSMKCSNIFLSGKCPDCGKEVKAKVL